MGFFDLLYLRTGHNFSIGAVDIEEAENIDENDYGAKDYKFSIGGGLKYTILNTPLKIGYNFFTRKLF